MESDRRITTTTDRTTSYALDLTPDHFYPVKTTMPHIKSKYRNVGWSIEKQKWVAKLMKDRMYRFLGYFNTELEAKQAVDRFNIEYLKSTIL